MNLYGTASICISSRLCAVLRGSHGQVAAHRRTLLCNWPDSMLTIESKWKKLYALKTREAGNSRSGALLNSIQILKNLVRSTQSRKPQVDRSSTSCVVCQDTFAYTCFLTNKYSKGKRRIRVAQRGHEQSVNPAMQLFVRNLEGRSRAVYMSSMDSVSRLNTSIEVCKRPCGRHSP